MPIKNKYDSDSSDHAAKKGVCSHPPGYMKLGELARDGYKLMCRKCGMKWKS